MRCTRRLSVQRLHQEFFSSHFLNGLLPSLTFHPARSNIRPPKLHQMFHTRRTPWKTELQQLRRAAVGA
jgi:hypothetical protein